MSTLRTCLDAGDFALAPFSVCLKGFEPIILGDFEQYQVNAGLRV